MTTTHDATSLAQFQSGVKYYEGQGRYGIMHFHINVADLKAQLGTRIDPNNGDIIQLWDIPIGTQITGVLVHIVTACTATVLATGVADTATMVIGDYTSAGVVIDADFYMDTALDLKTVAYAGTLVDDGAGAATKVYSAASILTITLAGNATTLLTGVLDIFAFCKFVDIPQAEPSSWT